jgi:hypothetical protein
VEGGGVEEVAPKRPDVVEGVLKEKGFEVDEGVEVGAGVLGVDENPNKDVEEGVEAGFVVEGAGELQGLEAGVANPKRPEV